MTALASGTLEVGCGWYDGSFPSLSSSSAKSTRSADEASSAKAMMVAASKVGQPFPFGAPIPAWLPGSDASGEPVAGVIDWEVLRREAPNGLVVAFLSTACPVVEEYEERLSDLVAQWSNRGVRLVALSVNAIPGDRFEALKDRIRDSGKYTYPYGHDQPGGLADALGVTATPCVVVIDRDGVIRYRGAFDDDFKPLKVKRSYVADALTALAQGRAPNPSWVRERGTPRLGPRMED